MSGRTLYSALGVVAVLGLLLAASSTSSGTVRKTYQVKGFTCARCASSLEAALKAKNGVLEVKADSTAGKLEVAFDTKVITEQEIEKAIEDAGFSLTKPAAPAPSPSAPRRCC